MLERSSEFVQSSSFLGEHFLESVKKFLGLNFRCRISVLLGLVMFACGFREFDPFQHFILLIAVFGAILFLLRGKRICEILLYSAFFGSWSVVLSIE